MQGDLDWEIVHNDYYRDDSEPIPPITIFPALTSHTIEILVTADSIKPTWFYAGRLYHLLDDPSGHPFPKTGEVITVPINRASVYQLKHLTDTYWLQYHPFRWFLWQSVRVRSYRYD